MDRRRGLCAILLAVAGCAPGPGADAPNAFNYCIAQGEKQGTPGFSACINDYIARLCTEEGHAEGSEAYRQCVEDLHQATFVRQQLQIRGF